MPIFQIDHIQDYSQTKEHELDNLTILCGTHHDLKTRRILSVEAILNRHKNPHNLQQNYSPPFKLNMAGERGELNLAGTKIITNQLRYNDNITAFEVGETSFSVCCENDHLLLSGLIHDENGNPILIIDKGELSLSLGLWDIVYQGPVLKMWYAQRSIGLELKFLPNGLEILRGCIRDGDDGIKFQETFIASYSGRPLVEGGFIANRHLKFGHSF